MSLAQVAAGQFSRAFLHQVELGKSQPSIGVLRMIAGRLDASIDYLLEGEGRFVRREVALEAARLALARGSPERALELIEPVRSTQAWPLGTDARLCAAEALLALDRRDEAAELLDAEEPLVRVRDDPGRNARISSLRHGRRPHLDLTGHEQKAEQALLAGDPAAALDHLRTARILSESSSAPLRVDAAASRRRPGPAPARDGVER